MLSGSAKLSEMFCTITSTSVENREVEFSMEIASISQAISRFPKIQRELVQ